MNISLCDVAHQSSIQYYDLEKTDNISFESNIHDIYLEQLIEGYSGYFRFCKFKQFVNISTVSKCQSFPGFSGDKLNEYGLFTWHAMYEAGQQINCSVMIAAIFKALELFYPQCGKIF